MVRAMKTTFIIISPIWKSVVVKRISARLWMKGVFSWYTYVCTCWPLLQTFGWLLKFL